MIIEGGEKRWCGLVNNPILALEKAIQGMDSSSGENLNRKKNKIKKGG